MQTAAVKRTGKFFMLKEQLPSETLYYGKSLDIDAEKQIVQNDSQS